MPLPRVSDNMLAVIASLQGGMHSRRTPKYLNENALVSDLYPLSYKDNTRQTANISSINNAFQYPRDSTVLETALEAEVRDSRIDHKGGDVYQPENDFSLGVEFLTTREVALDAVRDIYAPTNDVLITMQKYEIANININDRDTYTPVNDFKLVITRG